MPLLHTRLCKGHFSMQKNPLLRTIFPRRQLPVQENAPLVHRISSAELHPTVPGAGVPGAGNAPFVHRTAWHPVFRCRKCPFCAPFSLCGNFWCRKTLLLTPNCLAPNFPVREMPHLCTIFPVQQLLVQKNTLYDTELPGTQSSGAGNVPSVHRISSAATSGAEKHSF